MRIINSLFGWACLVLITTAPAANGSAYPSDRQIPPYIKQHRAHFVEGVSKVADGSIRAYTNFKGYMSNILVLEGTDGLVIFDAGSGIEHAEAVLKDVRTWSNKPVKALIYSHHHGDHTFGSTALVSPEQAASGEVKVIAHRSFEREYRDENRVTNPAMAWRSLFMYGTELKPADRADYHIGCCGSDLVGSIGLINPNTFVDDELELTIAGIRLQLFHSGGESGSHIVAYLPDQQVLLSGDEIYPALPNLHSPRGTKFRDTPRWIAAIDRFRQMDVAHLVPSHGMPISGAEEIERTLTIYRDAMQYQHDQAVRLINKGYSGERLGEELNQLPPYLDHEPFTRPMYGTVRHNVRNFFTGYISWFSGDPTDFQPTPRKTRSQRMVDLVGGRKTVLAAAQQHLDQGDPQAAAELSTLLTDLDREDWPARKLKAEALRRIGYTQINSTWRSWYLTAALELDGELDGSKAFEMLTSEFTEPQNLALLTLPEMLENLKYRVAAEQAGDKKISVTIQLTDSNETYSVILRRSVLEIIPGALESADATVTLKKSQWISRFLARAGWQTAVVKNEVEVTGDVALVDELFSYIEPSPVPGPLTLY